MSEEQKDKITGKAKEFAGKATDDEDLEREGKAQHGIAKVKDAVKGAAQSVSDAVKKKDR
ncbi:CsbD-like protein [Herbihabitans rhizosphaerae]|uniref:CsbD-like protein n=1 Tax=Herbihabitans rhizosphaerae TaxID=1872711 RepID=A0A4Q7KJQ9_9PSEU|nr:CsbD family protein [Herbihabitans rhizosphaerae]RZS36426.1 CsbD-like protein [Herbihabitans rhizosphaerae]